MKQKTKPPVWIDSCEYIQDLYSATKDLLAGKRGAKAAAKRATQKLAELHGLFHGAAGRKAHDAAQELAANPRLLDANDIEVDNTTIGYHNGADGWWVHAWLFVSDESIGEETDTDDEEISCPKGDPDCIGTDDMCHDACEAPDEEDELDA